MKTYEKLTHMLPESFIVASSISKRNCNGLFAMPRKYSGTNYQTTGVWNTNFANAMDIELNCKKFTLFELFHGLCYPYLSLFLSLNPEWKPMLLVRQHHFCGGKLVHAFAYKFLEDGTCLFADARGYNDNLAEFLDDFYFSKDTCLFLYEGAKEKWGLRFDRWKRDLYNGLYFDDSTKKIEFQKAFEEAYSLIWEEKKEFVA